MMMHGKIDLLFIKIRIEVFLLKQMESGNSWDDYGKEKWLLLESLNQGYLDYHLSSLYLPFSNNFDANLVCSLH